MIDTGLHGKVALVTGANHGIGAATAAALAREGAEVFLTYLRLSAGKHGATGPRSSDRTSEPGPGTYSDVLARGAEEVVASIRSLGGRCEVFEADLADPEKSRPSWTRQRRHSVAASISW